MGKCLNNKKVFIKFKSFCNGKYFVDKSDILEKFNEKIGSDECLICITRPPRFGKTRMTYLVASYYSKEIDSKECFDNLKISNSKTYSKHLNKHNVISINFSERPEKMKSCDDYINFHRNRIKNDLLEICPEIDYSIDTLQDAFDKALDVLGQGFIFVIDEWDYIFNRKLFTQKEYKKYTEFLSSMLKGKAYVDFVFMTGMLPVAKYASDTELNMFREYTMFDNDLYSVYFGFSEDEVKKLCEMNNEVQIEKVKEWYNGYITEKGDRIYNPCSIVHALEDNKVTSYWASTGVLDEISFFINKNVSEVLEDMVRLVAGENIEVALEKYSAEQKEIKTRKEILSVMVAYGFLTYRKGMLSIPNMEIMLKFEACLLRENMGYAYQIAIRSDKMLEATKKCDTETMEAIFEYAYDTEVPFFAYNDEESLACIVNLMYISARKRYKIVRKNRQSKGCVDYVFYPYDKTDAFIILELKYAATPREVINQLFSRHYYIGLRDKGYIGKILMVGINYDKEENSSKCIVEKLGL